jgi:hypothetical protein
MNTIIGELICTREDEEGFAHIADWNFGSEVWIPKRHIEAVITFLQQVLEKNKKVSP